MFMYEIQLTDGLVTACLAVKGNRTQQLRSLVLPSPALLWMVPAFCYCPQFLDPLDAEERCIAIQKTRSAKEANLNFTDDIWDKDLIQDWASLNESRLLLLQGNSQTTKRFERFAVEIVQAVKSVRHSQTVRLVYVLNPPRSRDSSAVGPSGLLQQIAVQCLQYVSPEEPVNFLIKICGKFKRAKTTQDWFGVLQDICTLIPSLYIVIDLAILGRIHEEIESWPAQFNSLFSYLKKSTLGFSLKVMLLSCHTFASQIGATLVIKTSPSILASPNRHKTSKQLLRIAVDSECTSFNQNEDPETADVQRNHDPNDPILLPSIGTASVQIPNTASTSPLELINVDAKSPSPPEPRHRSDFKIAIICALTLESDAVQDVFDNRWDDSKYGKTPSDLNQYTTGVIGRHNVVVVHMPGMGKTNGASAAANCRASFRSLGLVLVVGICGGVPFPNKGVEIVLGDVVISDGLIQYDLGRQFPDRFVRRHDTIARPDSEILSFLAKMKGRWNMKKLREQTTVHLKHLKGSTEIGAIAEYPGAWRDKLYEPTYRHKHQIVSTCGICDICQTKNDPVCEAALKLDCESLQCNDGHLIPRQRLAGLAGEDMNQKSTAEPLIHFGLYASGDKVMKSGEEREIIAKEEGVIAFEMEGSGVCESFPGRCLVVKAVCDYADSHKNKRWQNYAAASAAACTKALLEFWYP